MKWIFVFVSLAVLAFPVIACGVSLSEILAKADSANKVEFDLLKDRHYQFREEAVFWKLNESGSADKADTTISIVEMQGDNEVSREIIYTNLDDGKEKQKGKKPKDRNESLDMKLELSPENPDYDFDLVGEDDSTYLVSINPRKPKPEKGQIKGTYRIDRRSYLFRYADIEIPRPDKLKSMAMKLKFEKSGEFPLIISNIGIDGHARALLGIIDIKFKIFITRSDYEFQSRNSHD